MRSFDAAIRCLSLILALPLAQPASASDPVEDFYRGRQMTIVVGVSVGGGIDLYARVLARFMGRHIPGRPTIVVQNMPGAGTMKSVLYLNGVAPRDGTTIATFAKAMPIAPLLSDMEYNGQQLGYLGSIASETGVCVTWKASPVKQWADATVRDFTLGGLGKGGDPDVFASLIRTQFGSRHRLVTGYPGNADLMLAMERGEIDGICGLSYSTLLRAHPDWIKKGAVSIILQAGLQPDPALPGVPSILDLATGPRQAHVTKLAVAPQAMARPFATAPNVPPERLAALRAAFDRTMADPEFLAEAARLGLDVSPMSGSAMDRVIAELYATPKDILQDAVRALAAD